VLNSLYLYTMAGEAKMELIEPKEPKEPYTKWLEQPSKGGGEVLRNLIGLLWQSSGFYTGVVEAV
jgi:hypothetical protein